MMGDDPLDLSGVPMMGLHGVSKSAKDRKKNGLVYFNHFLEEVAQSKEATPKKWEDMAEAEICRVELFQAFGEFMKNRPNTGRGEPLSISTAQDYFSGAITYFKNDRYKDNAIWNGTGGVTDQAPVWYSTLRQQLATQAIRDAQKRGERIEKKSDEIGRAGLSQAIKRTLLDGSVKDSSSSIFMAATTALMMAFNFASVGRVSECQTASFDSMRWSDSKQCMIMVWPDIKTSTPQEMSYFNDFSDKYLDVYFLLALYLMGGCVNNQRSSRGGMDDADGVTFVFPGYATSGTPLSNLLTKALRNALEKLPEYEARSDGYDGTSLRFVYCAFMFSPHPSPLAHHTASLRRGATCCIVDHPDGGLEKAIIRGGWECQSITRLFEYHVGSLSAISVAGKILAGYDDPRQHVQQYTLVGVGDNTLAQRQVFDALKVLAFHGQVRDMSQHGRLWPLADNLLATVFAHAEAYYAENKGCKIMADFYRLAKPVIDPNSGASDLSRLRSSRKGTRRFRRKSRKRCGSGRGSTL
jgi:hypothetical protein